MKQGSVLTRRRTVKHMIHIYWIKRVSCSDAQIIRSYTRLDEMTREITQPAVIKIVTRPNTSYIHFCTSLHKTVYSPLTHSWR
jgi:hypothetical protein